MRSRRLQSICGLSSSLTLPKLRVSYHANRENQNYGLDLSTRKLDDAILANASLVPVIAFGENDLYLVFEPGQHWVARVQNIVKNFTGIAVPIFGPTARGVA